MRFLVLLAAVIWMSHLPAEARIVGKRSDDPPPTATGGLTVPPGRGDPFLQCWVGGRLIFDEADPFLLSLGLAERPATVLMRRGDGTQSVITVVGHLPSACFGRLAR